MMRTSVMFYALCAVLMVNGFFVNAMCSEEIKQLYFVHVMMPFFVILWLGMFHCQLTINRLHRMTREEIAKSENKD